MINSHESLISGLSELATDRGWPVSYRTPEQMAEDMYWMGDYETFFQMAMGKAELQGVTTYRESGEPQSIWINTTLDVPTRAATLGHEVGHMWQYLGLGARRDQRGEELLVDLSARVIFRHFHLTWPADRRRRCEHGHCVSTSSMAQFTEQATEQGADLSVIRARALTLGHAIADALDARQ